MVVVVRSQLFFEQLLRSAALFSRDGQNLANRDLLKVFAPDGVCFRFVDYVFAKSVASLGVVDDKSDFKLWVVGLGHDNFVREGGIVELFLFDLFYGVPVGLADSGRIGLIETLSLTTCLQLRRVALFLGLDGAFDDGRIAVVLNTDESGGFDFLLRCLMNDFSRSALFFTFYALFAFDNLFFDGLGPGESDPCLPSDQFLVFTFDRNVLVVGTLTLLHHRLVFSLLNRGNLDHWAGFTERDAGNSPEEGLHHLGHDLERVTRVLDQESETI